MDEPFYEDGASHLIADLTAYYRAQKAADPSAAAWAIVEAGDVGTIRRLADEGPLRKFTWPPKVLRRIVAAAKRHRAEAG